MYVDIKTFAPPWAELPKPAAGDAVATDAAELSEDECDQSKGFHALAAVLQRGMGGPPAKNRRRLDIVRWQAAFDKLALGCAESHLTARSHCSDSTKLDFPARSRC